MNCAERKPNLGLPAVAKRARAVTVRHASIARFQSLVSAATSMRDLGVKHMKSVPGFNDIGKMPWYPDKRYPGVIGRSQAELRARS
jgi:hypothetical protein